jgi:coenzyme F420-reducing hydrogenase alpha subunit
VVIRIDELTRIEGHGSLTINVRDRRVEELRLDIFEGSRFFESLLVGRKCSDAAEISSRICGICAIAHYLTALKAVERALGVVPSEQTVELRRLLYLAGNIQSHVAHLYFLALPDYLGYESAFAMLKERPEDVKRAFRMRELANDLIEAIGGRLIHPFTLVIGGTTSLPPKSKLEGLLKCFRRARKDALDTADLLASLEMPSFERETEYLALRKGEMFPIYDGEEIASTDGLSFPVMNYHEQIKEFVVPHSTAKHSVRKSSGRSFSVGPLARINLNGRYLSDAARDWMGGAGVRFPSSSPFMNNIARAVEVIHYIDEVASALERLLGAGLAEERPEVKMRAGEGIAATEAPRGTLYYHFKLNGEGRIEYADIITPTAQNLENMEEDLRALAPKLLELPRKEMVLILEELIRAYDPCITCSTHLLQVKLV